MGDQCIREGLESLYKGYKAYGPYIRKDRRAYFVCALRTDGVIQHNSSKFSIMRARALLEVRLNRVLAENEDADHINGVATDDSPENIQLLTKEDHRAKSGKEASERTCRKILALCPYCGTAFKCRRWNYEVARAKGRVPCCSYSCSAKANKPRGDRLGGSSPSSSITKFKGSITESYIPEKESDQDADQELRQVFRHV